MAPDRGAAVFDGGCRFGHLLMQPGSISMCTGEALCGESTELSHEIILRSEAGQGRSPAQRGRRERRAVLRRAVWLTMSLTPPRRARPSSRQRSSLRNHVSISLRARGSASASFDASSQRRSHILAVLSSRSSARRAVPPEFHMSRLMVAFSPVATTPSLPIEHCRELWGDGADSLTDDDIDQNLTAMPRAWLDR